jgi:hypothetical protein
MQIGEWYIAGRAGRTVTGVTVRARDVERARRAGVLRMARRWCGGAAYAVALSSVSLRSPYSRGYYPRGFGDD